MTANVEASSVSLKAFDKYKLDVQEQFSVITGTLTTRSKAKADQKLKRKKTI